MRRAAIGLLAPGILLALCGIATAAAHTISWIPVATYTDGAPITGKTVTYSVYWSASASLSSLTMFAYGLTQTSKTFDPAALGMTPGSTVYFTLRTTASTGESSAYSSPRPWVVPTATSASGGASTNRTSNVVEVVLSGPASPGNLRIESRETGSRETWRFSWDPVTRLANGREIGSERIVRYDVYWTRDPSLAAGTLVPLATPASAAYVDFEPPDREMTKNEIIYFTLQAILDTGERSSLSVSLPWRVASKGPAAPSDGRIETR